MSIRNQTGFPIDIWTQIFGYLNYRDWPNICCTCVLFKSLGYKNFKYKHLLEQAIIFDREGAIFSGRVSYRECENIICNIILHPCIIQIPFAIFETVLKNGFKDLVHVYMREMIRYKRIVSPLDVLIALLVATHFDDDTLVHILFTSNLPFDTDDLDIVVSDAFENKHDDCLLVLVGYPCSFNSNFILEFANINRSRELYSNIWRKEMMSFYKRCVRSDSFP